MATPISALRTPDARFADLPDFPYAPHYVDSLVGFEGLRLARIDEGPPGADHTFLCLHGQPTWSFLYRRMIPVFLASGARVVAPDLFGFGRSDKPVDETAYSFGFHRRTLLALVEHLNLQRITLVVQDWGGVLGLTLPLDAAFRARLSRLIVMNTGLPTGAPAGPGFDAWRDYVARTPDFPVGRLMGRSCPHLTPAEIAAYDAPFPDATFKAGVRRFPQLVPTEPGMEGADLGRAARAFWRDDWRGPSFMAYGATDPVFPPEAMERLRGIIHGCPAALVVAEGGHFVQEWGRPIAEAALAAFSQAA